MLKPGRTAGGCSAEGTASAEAVDVRLIGMIAKGELQAFEALYRGFFPRLTRFLGRMTRSAQLIEEIVNDTMLVVWQKASSYDHSCKVSTWIFAIAYRKALNAIRSIDEPVEYDNDDNPELSDHEPEREASRRQLQKTLAIALDALPADQRNVFNLAYYHGMGYDEIAEIIDCPVNTVKTRMFHARRRMRVALSPHLEGWQ